MIPTIEIPSAYNKVKITAESSKPFNTSLAPFEFYNEDECGNRTPYDLTPYTYNMEIYEGDCLVLTITNLVVTNTNQLYIDEPILNLDFGVYTLKINQIGFNSLISGKITVI